MTFEIIPATERHVAAICRRMLAGHEAAIIRLGIDAHRELKTVFAQSLWARTWMVGGKIGAVGGITGTLASPAVFVWLVISRDGARFPVAMVKEARRQLDEMMETHEAVTTTIFAGDDASFRFAARLGFRSTGDGSMELRREWSKVAHPFVVFAVPRSRTAWLAAFLNCAHDALISGTSLGDLCTVIERRGAVETALAPAWRAIRERLPQARFVVIRRPMADVVASAARIGWNFPTPYLADLVECLEEISAQPGTLTVSYAALETEQTCEAIASHVGAPFDRARWKAMSAVNVQIDPPVRAAQVHAAMPTMVKVMAEAAAVVTFQIERFDAWWRDGQDLIEAHHQEAGPTEGLAFDPNTEMARSLEAQGQLMITTARRGRQMIGYLFFVITPILECRDATFGFQNIFFVRRDHRGRVGLRMHAFARRELKARGVHALMLRTGLKASGDRQAALFKRLGATPFGSLYSLSMGE